VRFRTGCAPLIRRHSGARRQAASPESIFTDHLEKRSAPDPLDLWLWIPDLPLRGNPE
jgi:hypothetical protein